MYKALFFDIDDTIFNFAACSKNALRETCAVLGTPFDDSIYEAFRGIDTALWNLQKQGALTVQSVLDIRFPKLFARLGVEADAAAAPRIFAKALSGQTAAEPHAAAALQNLCAKYRLHAASNGELEMQRRRLELAGLLPCFEGVYVSDDIGYDKPDSRFFKECLGRSGLAPQDVLMIGDSLEADIAGAGRCGMDTCWYNPRGAQGGGIPNYTIVDLLQLVEILADTRGR